MTLVNDRLLAVLDKVDPQKRYFTGAKANKEVANIFGNKALVFGLQFQGTTETLTEIPDAATDLRLFLTSDVDELLYEILNTGIGNRLTRLEIGGAKNNGIDYKNYDFSKVSSVLEQFDFPELTVFTYGDDSLLANEHKFYGNLGNITNVLPKMSNLRELELFGNFVINKPITFPSLRQFVIIMDDWATHVNGGKISAESIENLLSSHYPKLKELEFNLDFNDEAYEYRIPENFLNGVNAPQLSLLSFAGKFKKGSLSAVQQSTFIGSIKSVEFNEMTDS